MTTVHPRRHGHRAGRIYRAQLLVAALTLAIAGCGQTDAGETSAAASATSPKSAEAKPGDAGSTAEAMGIDSVEWPGKLPEADALFDRMPDELSGVPVKRWRASGTSTGVVYGSSGKGATAWVMGPTKGAKTPESALAVMFGLGLDCKKGTYTGTASESPYGGGPARQVNGRAGDGMWWFACTMVTGGAEGDAVRTGHAVGWVSDDLAYLTTSPDQRTAESLIEALIDAA